MTKIKIYGAGSIGNHLSYACRRLGWDVTVCDVQEAALARMKNDIYPSRYEKWDPTIQQFTNDQAPKGGFDYIFIGTPPEYHIPLALEALKETPKAILIEKPLCNPSLDLAHTLWENASASQTKVFVGYTHVVGKSAAQLESLVRKETAGTILTLDVEFREHWAGIFKAHSWLKGPEDTYLGYWQRGGGASGEHSHAMNFWQYLADVSGGGRVVEVEAMLRYVTEGRAVYDDLCFLNLRTEKGMSGRVVQDVVTRPARKRARLQGKNAILEWVNDYSPEGDAVLVQVPGQKEETQMFAKKRPDDFFEEVKHLEYHVKNPSIPSPIRLEKGLDTMMVLAAAHLSEKTKSRIRIDYSKGYRLEALSSVH